MKTLEEILSDFISSYEKASHLTVKEICKIKAKAEIDSSYIKIDEIKYLNKNELKEFFKDLNLVTIFSPIKITRNEAQEVLIKNLCKKFSIPSASEIEALLPKEKEMIDKEMNYIYENIGYNQAIKEMKQALGGKNG